MLLTSKEIEEQNVVIESRSDGKRATTYDATVGSILLRGREIKEDEFWLPPRGIVWLISAETFDVPNNATGLATLRTTWTHDGVLALNVGVVDPLWKGPLAATVVNFGNSHFEIKKGDTFLRLMFHSHPAETNHRVEKTMDDYKKEIAIKSKLYSSTFLDIESLVPEVAEKVYGMPKSLYNFSMLGILIAISAIFVAVGAIFVPVAIDVWSDYRVGSYKIETFQEELDHLESRIGSDFTLDNLDARLTDVERSLQRQSEDILLPVPDVPEEPTANP